MKPQRVHNVDEAAHLLMKERGYVVVGLLETALGFCPGDTTGKFGADWLDSCDLMLVKRTNRKDWGDQITLLGLQEINGKTKAEYWQCKTVAKALRNPQASKQDETLMRDPESDEYR